MSSTWNWDCVVGGPALEPTAVPDAGVSTGEGSAKEMKVMRNEGDEDLLYLTFWC